MTSVGLRPISPSMIGITSSVEKKTSQCARNRVQLFWEMRVMKNPRSEGGCAQPKLEAASQWRKGSAIRFLRVSDNSVLGQIVNEVEKCWGERVEKQNRREVGNSHQYRNRKDPLTELFGYHSCKPKIFVSARSSCGHVFLTQVFYKSKGG